MRPCSPSLFGGGFSFSILLRIVAISSLIKFLLLLILFYNNPDYFQNCLHIHRKLTKPLSSRKPIFYFFLLWEMCLFLASVPTYPASHAETKKPFHFSSHLSHLKKRFLSSLSTVMLTPLSFSTLCI